MDKVNFMKKFKICISNTVKKMDRPEPQRKYLQLI